MDTGFRGGAFVINQVSLTGVSGACDTQTLTVMLAIKDSGMQYGDPAVYSLGDVIVCRRTLALDAGSETNVVTLLPGPCSIDGGGPAVSLREVSTQDLMSGPSIGVEVTG